MQNLNLNTFVFKLLLGFFLMCNFSFFNYFSKNKFSFGLFNLYGIDRYMEIYKATERAAEKVGTKHNLYPVCIGREKNEKEQDVIEIGFDNDSKPLLIDEAREKLIPCFQDFLNEINRDQKLLKVFSNKPITPENVNFYIINYTENHIYNILHPFIRVMVVNKGIVTFKSVQTRLQPRSEKIEETYEEALEKLQKQKTKDNPLGK